MNYIFLAYCWKSVNRESLIENYKTVLKSLIQKCYDSYIILFFTSNATTNL